MKIRNVESRLATLGFFFFLALISISNLTTTHASRFYIEATRQLLAIVILCIMAISIAMSKSTNRVQLFSFLSFLSMLLYAIIMSYFSGSFNIGSINLQRDSLIILSGTFILSINRVKNDRIQIAKYYSFYTVIGLLLIMLTQGIELSFPPRFNFQYSSDIYNANILYSQGISQFFGFGALTGLYISSKSVYNRLTWLVFSIACLALSLLGGARGDVLAVLLVMLGFTIYRYKKKNFLLLLSFSILTFILIGYWDYLSDHFILFKRLSVFSFGDYGSRDILFSQAVELLLDEPACLMFGCGTGYFQHYYDVDFGWYPHNFLMELIVTFGLPFVIILFLLVSRGIKIYVKMIGEIDLIILFFMMSFIISLKSGYIFGNWLTMSIMIYFIGISLTSLLTQHKTKRFDPTR